MKRDHDAVKAELERLKADGVIKPADVVDFARDENTALHACFTWDDSEAAQQYRLLEARNILRVYVTTEASDTSSVRAFVSLTTDRTKEGGGYRSIADVMSDDALREQMLRDAFAQFKTMQQRYKALQQLSKVWEAVDAAEQATQVKLQHAA